MSSSLHSLSLGITKQACGIDQFQKEDFIFNKQNRRAQASWATARPRTALGRPEHYQQKYSFGIKNEQR